MNENEYPNPLSQNEPVILATHESRGFWSRLLLVLKVIEVRLRFIAVLVAVGLLIGYWDTIKNHWDKWVRPAAAAGRELPPGEELYCPMHPQVIRNSYEPNGSVPNCPICGMQLTKRTKGEEEKEPVPEGVTARVQLSPERIRLAGVQTVEVGYAPLTYEIATVGSVAYDESRLSRVVSRVKGYVEKLYVDRTFVRVNRGDPLAEVYSPDLYTTAQELVLLGRGSAAADLAGNARRRLKLFGVSDEEINGIVAAGEASRTLVLRSPRSGYVVRKNVVLGTQVDDGMALLEVADLGQVWIEADVYEKDILLVREGQKIEARVEALPGRTFAGAVAVVYPQLDTATRTNRVRFQVANPAGELRPGMNATVRIEVPLAVWAEAVGSSDGKAVAASPSPRPSPGGKGGTEVLVVPERAVIDTGARQIVYVESKPGQFDGVEVQLGPRSGEFYPVLKGLKAGQRVAAAGAFLIDAETRLNPALASTYYGASGGPQSAGHSTSVKPQAHDAKHDAPKEPNAAARRNINKLPPADRDLALAQGACPITDQPLGSMGVPVKLVLKGQAVFLCCAGCTEEAQANPDKTLEKVARFKEARRAKKGQP